VRHSHKEIGFDLSLLVGALRYGSTLGAQKLDAFFIALDSGWLGFRHLSIMEQISRD
jgi:hypothetical protein